MKNISREIIVGLTAITTVLVFIWLFSFLKGNNIFTRNDRYLSIYDDIGGLEESGLVEINGHKAGIVRDIRFLDDGSGRLLVSLSVKSGYRLPEGTTAEIAPETILAGMKVKLIPGDGPGYHTVGDTLKSSLNTGLLGNISDNLTPLVKKADQIITEIDTLLKSLNMIAAGEMMNNLHQSSENIEKLSYKLDTLLENSGENIHNLILNLDRFADMIGENTEQIDTTINQFSSIARDLAESNIEASIDNFNTTVKETGILLERLNHGKGSAGLLLNDDSLYINLTTSLEQLNALLEDLKANPGRYVNFSIFGKNK